MPDNKIQMPSPGIEWMPGSFGIGVHWTNRSVPASGEAVPFLRAAEAFNVPRFVEQLQEMGARHCIFTLAHAEQFLPLPHPSAAEILPGRTARRDLAGELADALRAAGIRLILYYNHSCNGSDDFPWQQAVGYREGPLDSMAERLCGIVAHIAERYRGRFDGWWFDSCYTLDPRGPYDFTTRPMGEWRFPWDKLAEAARSGSQEAALTFNAGPGERYLYTLRQEYYSGEAETLDSAYEPEPEDLLLRHRWVCIDNPAWVHTEPGFHPCRFTDAALRDFMTGHLSHGTMVTLNVEIDQNGAFNPASLRQLNRLEK